MLPLGIEQLSLGHTARNIVTIPTTVFRIRRWKDNIKADLEITEYQGMGCTYVAQDTVHFRFHISTVMHPGVMKTGNLLLAEQQPHLTRTLAF